MFNYLAKLNFGTGEHEICEVEFSVPVHVGEQINVNGLEFHVFSIKHFNGSHSTIDCDATQSK